MNNIEDKKISDALLYGTEEITELKDMVWSNIEKELNLNVSIKEQIKPKKNKILSFAKYGSIAAAVVIVLGLNTQYGQATVGKIKDLFIPNKVVKQQLEGTEEQGNMSLKEGSMKYIIYIDEERYALAHLEGKDRITAKSMPQNAPEVFMEISQVKDKSPKIIASELQNELMSSYVKVENRGTVNDPIKATLVYANSGVEWNSAIIKYYLIDNTKGGTFIIKQQFFLEAEEGHGARLNNMLKEFKIVNQ